MLKAILIAAASTVAAIWAICAWLYFSPVDGVVEHRREPPPTAGNAATSASPPASPRRDEPAPIAPAGGDVSRAARAVNEGVASAPPRDTAPVPEVVLGTNSDEEAKRRALADTQARIAATPEPGAPPPPGPATPQYSSLGGYVLDADSVVVAPPTTTDGPGSAAEKRRQVRLSTDISRIP